MQNIGENMYTFICYWPIVQPGEYYYWGNASPLRFENCPKHADLRKWVNRTMKGWTQLPEGCGVHPYWGGQLFVTRYGQPIYLVSHWAGDMTGDGKMPICPAEKLGHCKTCLRKKIV